MTLTRTQLVLVIMVAVAGLGATLAVFYVEKIFKAREDKMDLIHEGRAEDLMPRAPVPPPAHPPLDRSTRRSLRVLHVTREDRTVVSVRGNGEFERLPSLPDEPGPIVTGVLDRAQLDDILRSVIEDAAPTAGPYAVAVALSDKPQPPNHRKGYDATRAAKLLALTGRNMQRNATPEAVFLRLSAAGAGEAPPWPFDRMKPAAFLEGGRLASPVDRARFREDVLKLLAPDARFAADGKVYAVALVDLLP